MSSQTVEQATYCRIGAAPPQRLAQSAGFLDDWHAKIESILMDFGSRPDGWSCPSAVFAQPLGKRHVLIVHAADLMPGDAMPQAPVGYHALVLARDLYRSSVGDPFSVVERFTPNWHARGVLPTLSWPMEAPARRTVEQVRQVLQRVKGEPLREDVPAEEQEFPAERHSESPALLGGTQVLVDGGRLVFERPRPDTDLLKALWTLLPNSTRSEIWPASFAFSNRLQFDVVVAPQFDMSQHEGYTTEEQAADYPEGRYELHLQIAAESGNQRELDHLFERRSWGDTWRLAISLMIAVIVLAVASRLLVPLGENTDTPDRLTEVRQKQAAIAAGVVGMNRPLETLTLYPAAFEEGKKLKEQLK